VFKSPTAQFGGRLDQVVQGRSTLNLLADKVVMSATQANQVVVLVDPHHAPGRDVVNVDVSPLASRDLAPIAIPQLHPVFR
jgi:hypothetical protein